MSIVQQINKESVSNLNKYFKTAMKMLSEIIYSDQTHFIFELLQNAEDAIRQREHPWGGSKTIEFYLSHDQLRISHFGIPFNEKDVEAICSVGESTKDDLTDIGHFGMGFKSVYKYTERPAIHSGSGETAFDFAINNYIYPSAISPIERDTEETVFILPFKSEEEETSYNDITKGLYEFEVLNLLFLREIDTIQWTVKDGSSGFYRRESETLNCFTRSVQLTDKWDDNEPLNQEWLVFSRPVKDKDNNQAGYVEIAFKFDSDHNIVEPINSSPLIVYFATNEETGLNFLVQGPYQTTLNRESIPYTDWNKRLVNETFSLIREALYWMRDEGRLSIDVLNCLPLLQTNEQKGVRGNRLESYLANIRNFKWGWGIGNNRFKSYPANIKELLKSERLLPTINGEYISASEALLTRSQGVRDLLSIEQISILYDIDHPAWLDSNITQDRTRDLYDYLIHELKVLQITPEGLIRRLKQTFLENQTEEWIIKLYEFLNTHRASKHLYRSSPIIRLNDGKHLTPEEEVFLPSKYKIDFPTIDPKVCNDRTIKFLRHLGLRKPDLVDDVSQHVLVKYDGKIGNGADWSEYANDIERIIYAYNTGSEESKARLIVQLEQTPFVATIDAHSGLTSFSKPPSIYLATERLRTLLRINGVRFIDANQACLEGQIIQEILKEAGANKSLKITAGRNLSWHEKYELRKETECTRDIEVINYNIDKLDDILEVISDCNSEQARLISRCLWEELIHLRKLYGEDIFEGEYSWMYYKKRSQPFDAEFLEKLNNTPWIPNVEGELNLPTTILFKELGWREDPYLQSKIQFKPPEVEQLAQKVGITPDVLDEFMRQVEQKGITTPSDLRRIMGDPEESSDDYQQDNNGTVPDDSDDNLSSFSELIIQQQALGPSDSSSKPFFTQEVGPRTPGSAKSDTIRSDKSGRKGRRINKTIRQYELADDAKHQKRAFRDMVRNDYQGRCQICGSFFLTRKEKRDQTFITHIVPPSIDFRTNHVGNMLGLCGWHYALMEYGQRDLLNPETTEPFDSSEELEQISYNLEKELDKISQSYVILPVRFYNAYPQWREEAESIDEEIQFSKTHWIYWCERLRGSRGSNE